MILRRNQVRCVTTEVDTGAMQLPVAVLGMIGQRPTDVGSGYLFGVKLTTRYSYSTIVRHFAAEPATVGT